MMEMLLSYFYLHIRQVIYKSSELQHFHTISKFKYIISKHMFSLINRYLCFITKDPVVCQDSLVSKALLQRSQNTFS
jgi:hypothetical protein